MNKKCCACNRTFSIIHFNKCSNSKDSLDYRCKQCRSVASKEYYHNRQKKYNHICKDACLDQLRKCSTCDQYYPYIFFHIASKRKDGHERRCRYCLYKQSAQRRGLVFELIPTVFWKLLQDPCFICNVREKYKLNGIDRVFNEKPYIESNCITMCFKCNQAKLAQTPQDFFAWIFRLLKNRSQDEEFIYMCGIIGQQEIEIDPLSPEELVKKYSNVSISY